MDGKPRGSHPVLEVGGALGLRAVRTWPRLAQASCAGARFRLRAWKRLAGRQINEMYEMCWAVAAGRHSAQARDAAALRTLGY